MPGPGSLFSALLSTAFGIVALLTGATGAFADQPLLVFDGVTQLSNLQPWGGQQNASLFHWPVPAASGPTLEMDVPAPDGMFVNQTYPAPRDWSGFTAISVTLAHDAPGPLSIGVAWGDVSGNLASQNITVPGGTAPQTFTLLFNTAPLPGEFLPPGISVVATNLDYSHVTGLRISSNNPYSSTCRIFITGMTLATNPMAGLVDQYGQYAGSDWAGKIHSDQEMNDARANEMANLQPAPSGWNKYGGWRDGPMLAATGHFRTQRAGGRWWLVTPDGRLFFATAMGVVDSFGGWSITGPNPLQRSLFDWLPSGIDPRAQSPFTFGASPTLFNFYQSNLYRLDGQAWRSQWDQRAMARLGSWGFNSLGFAASPDLVSPATRPYMNLIQVTNSYGAGPGAPADAIPLGLLNFLMPDPFNPEYRARLNQTIAAQIGTCPSDPMCIGVFVDNELPWDSPWSIDYNVPRAVLSMTVSQPDTMNAKTAFAQQLESEYGDISNFNAAWDLSLASWNDFLAEAIGLPTPMNAQQTADCSAFLSAMASLYYQTAAAAVHRYAPQTLYLGSRFSEAPIEAVTAAANWVDVVSFNYYQPQLDPSSWSYTDTLGKPCMISEFAFGSPSDSGMFASAFAVSGQAARGLAYTRYVESIMARPAFVGVEWLSYLDEPLASGGENEENGFVSVTDTVYSPLATAAASVNRSIYATLQQAMR